MKGLNLMDQKGGHGSAVKGKKGKKGGGLSSLFKKKGAKGGGSKGPMTSSQIKKKQMLFFFSIFLIFGSRFALNSKNSRTLKTVKIAIFRMDSKISEIKQKVEDVKAAKKEMVALKERRKQAKKKLDVVKSLDKNRNHVLNVVDFMVSEMPQEVWWSSMKLTKATVGNQKSITFKACSIDLPSIGTYIDSLNSGTFFTSWELSSANTSTSCRPANSGLPAEVKEFDLSSTAKEVLQ